MGFNYQRVREEVEGQGTGQRLLTFAHAVNVAIYEPANQDFFEVFTIVKNRKNVVRALYDSGWRAVVVDGVIGFEVIKNNLY